MLNYAIEQHTLFIAITVWGSQSEYLNFSDNESTPSAPLTVVVIIVKYFRFLEGLIDRELFRHAE